MTNYPAFCSDLGRMRMLGGHRAIDVANALHWCDGRQVDFTRDYDELVRWCVPAGILSATERDALIDLAGCSSHTAADVHWSWVRLRTALKAFLEGSIAPYRSQPGAAIASELAHELERAVPNATFVPVGGRITIGSRQPLALPLVRATLAAGELLTSRAIFDIRKCEADPCGGFFLDPRYTRRWCAMDSCGNRAKVLEQRRQLRTVEATG